MGDAVLEIRGLTAHYDTVTTPVLRDVSLSLQPGEILGIVGESGCGKTSLLKCIVSPRMHGMTVDAGSICYQGQDLLALNKTQRQALLGNHIGLIVQDSISSLNPIRKIRAQVRELLAEKQGVSAGDADRAAAELLRRIHCPADTLDKYPFQMSGGQRQRALIAMALLLHPGVLLADEPTTALDVTVQAQLLQEIRRLAREHETGVLLITHNFGVVAGIADRICVMYGGRIVESGETDLLLSRPGHPYTQALLQCIPDLKQPRSEELFHIPDGAAAREDGCVFSERCAFCRTRCREEPPPVVQREGGWYACFR